jgi:hypothetical protein
MVLSKSPAVDEKKREAVRSSVHVQEKREDEKIRERVWKRERVRVSSHRSTRYLLDQSTHRVRMSTDCVFSMYGGCN